MMFCLIFHTAIIINRKNWRITIKLHFENLSIFFLKRTYIYASVPVSPCLFLFVIQWPPPPLFNERIFWMTPNYLFQPYIRYSNEKFLLKHKLYSLKSIVNSLSGSLIWEKLVYFWPNFTFGVQERASSESILL